MGDRLLKLDSVREAEEEDMEVVMEDYVQEKVTTFQSADGRFSVP